ncbi:predicted protein [Nematostella vectensis]|uniref:Mutator-like transposase domain-containing protein n=1 Tax=Nematostella vectensis TaxID=45351 RepID=A7SZ36_NEMVE|nr:predicted protein [Nematostella vectensis]|eukprot:XP_001623128.1 predicted protein [Nematostella vectensis]
MKYYEGKENGVHALVAQKDQPNPAMKWTNAHDTLLDREILTNEPWICRNGSKERGEIWRTIATILNPIEEPVFKVSQRSVRDRYFYTLEKNNKDKVKAEARASGICPTEETDVDQGVRNIMELFEHDSENQKRSEQKNKHTDEDKAKAEEMQKQSLETFKESRKREDNDEPKPQKRKATGSDKMMYLKERGEIKDNNRAEELKLRKAEITEQADALPGHCWAIAKGSSGRLEENLRRETGKVLSLYKKCKGGRNRRELDKRYAEFSILSKELESISKLRDEYEDVNLELQEWKNKCTDLELQKKTLLEELKQVQQTNCEEIEVLEALNEELKAYALALEEGDEKLCCSSKKISELKSMNILFDETKSEVIKLWEDFHSLYLLICCANADETTPDSIHQKAKAWIELFSKLGAKRVGYGNARVTPYMHAVPYHIPQFILSHGPIIQFSGQGVEKNNDDAKRIYFQKSNKWDAAKDILLLESRQKSLEHHEREKRKYVKRNEEWWNSKILDSRKRRRNTESNYTATTRRVQCGDCTALKGLGLMFKQRTGRNLPMTHPVIFDELQRSRLKRSSAKQPLQLIAPPNDDLRCLRRRKANAKQGLGIKTDPVLTIPNAAPPIEGATSQCDTPGALEVDEQDEKDDVKEEEEDEQKQKLMSTDLDDELLKAAEDFFDDELVSAVLSVPIPVLRYGKSTSKERLCFQSWAIVFFVWLENRVFHFEKQAKSYEVNRRLVYSMRSLGKGHSGAKRFCTLMNMPPPLTARAYSKNSKTIIISMDNGKVLDTEALSQSCKQCQQHPNLDKESMAYKTWWAEHSFKCNANYHGSAPGMESVGASRLFSRSIDKHKLRYSELYADGDSKSHTEVEHIYEDDNVVVEKKNALDTFKRGWEQHCGN